MKKIIILLVFTFIISSCYVLNNPFSGYLFDNDILTKKGSVIVNLSQANIKENKEFIFYLYNSPIDNTKDYIGKGSFVIQSGKGFGFVNDIKNDGILEIPYGKFVDIYGYINDNSYPILSENATNLSKYNTTGQFGGERRLLKLNGESLIEGSNYDYQYNSQLTIYDDQTSDNFKEGKFLRIVHDNLNVTDSSDGGFGLIPLAKNLKDNNQFPAYPYFFIDPDNGKFILPSPIYWSKMESYDEIINPEISDTVNYHPVIQGYPSPYQGFISSGIFGFCYEILLPGTNDVLNQDSYIIKPFGDKKMNWNEGTLSAWVNLDSDVDTNGYISFIGKTEEFKIEAFSNDNHFYIRFYIKGINDNMPEDFIIDDSLEGSWVHIFAIWDMEKYLTNSKHVKIFANGNLILSSSKTIDLSDHNFIIESFAQDGILVGYPTVTSIDNLMIWNNVVCDESSDFISYIYNNKSNPNVENAIYPCYTSKYNYHPTSNIKVGYYSGGKVLWPNVGESSVLKNKILINNNLIINFGYSSFASYIRNNNIILR